jgi:hypothetical protein
MIMLRRMRKDRHIARIGVKRNAYELLVGGSQREGDH